MPNIVTLGEALIDMVSTTTGLLSDAPGFEKAAGGAPANVAAGLGCLGASVGFVGKVGRDPWGVFLRDTLADCDVDTTALVQTADEFTRLAFVSLRDDGGHDFLFHGLRGADELLQVEDLDEEYIASAAVFHFGSITTIKEPARAATLRAVAIANEAGAVISYDPNYRPPLWGSEGQARERMLATLPLVHVIKVSSEELKLLTGTEDPVEGAKGLLAQGPELVALTFGAQGCTYFLGERYNGSLPGFPVPVVDTVGCGDAFVAGMLLGILECERDLSEMTAEDLEATFRFANAAGALTATGKGAIPSLPGREEVEELLHRSPGAQQDEGF